MSPEIIRTLEQIVGSLTAIMLTLSGQGGNITSGINIQSQFAQVAAPQTITFTSSGSWTAPSGISSAVVEAWSAGGGGGCGGLGGGGGGGGAYSKKTVTVTPGASYSVVVGKIGRAHV